MSLTFHCYEFLSMKKLQEDDELWNKLKKSVETEGYHSYKNLEIPTSLWFLSVTLRNAQDKFEKFILKEIEADSVGVIRAADETLLSSYLNSNAFVELKLDNIFKYGEQCHFPHEIFCCPNIQFLSLKCNFLDHLPADVGRMEKLETLALTNNKLQNNSLPYTLTFCKKLKVLLLDNNLLDALPGFLLHIPSLQTVHRHGNHNYFKATFMWYHTDFNDRILHVAGTPSVPQVFPKIIDSVDKLQFLAARKIIAMKFNFYASHILPKPLKDYISDLYPMFNLCMNCQSTCLLSESGYKVYTFKNPYLGNTCVPFQHWACGFKCAEAIEIPAHLEQIRASQEQDRIYDQQVQAAQEKSGSLGAGRPSPLSSDQSSNLGCSIL